MLIKEYIIPLPLTVEEYRIAQLYMVAKVSKERTHDGEGIEIVKNEPYEDDTGKGQYTHKIIRVGRQIPSWVKYMMPASVLQVEEKAWNAFPYVRSEFASTFLGDRFSIKTETRYIDGNQVLDNVHNLPADVWSQVERKLVDIAFDPIDPSVYKESEDPKKFKSEKTGRGPLGEGWMKTTQPMMYIYKLVTVNFNYWGLQWKAESLIHQMAVEDTVLRSHRQAFIWIDEWFGLTMEQIREIEEKTKEELKQLINTTTEGANNNAAQ